MSYVKPEVLTVAVEKLLQVWTEPYMQEVATRARINEARIQKGRDMLQQCKTGRADLAMTRGAQTEMTNQKETLRKELRLHIRDLKQSIRDAGMSDSDLRRLGIFPTYQNLEVPVGANSSEQANGPDEPEVNIGSENGQGEEGETRASRRQVLNTREEKERMEWTTLFANIHKLPEQKLLELAEYGWNVEFLTEIGAQVAQFVELCDVQDQYQAASVVATRQIRATEQHLQDWYTRLTQKIRRYARGMADKDTILGVAQSLESYRVA